MGEERLAGMYRGVVVQNVDPMLRGRIQVQVPGIVMPPSTWAEACLPFTGTADLPAGLYALPPVGAGVWVAFEQGDPAYPIWVGGIWSSAPAGSPAAALPAPLPPSQNVVLQTTLQNRVILSDAAPTPVSGGIVIQSSTGASIVVNDLGIFINNGKGATIVMVGPAININNDALVIT